MAEEAHEKKSGSRPRMAGPAVTATLTWNQLRVVVKDTKGNEKVILKDVSGYLTPNHMLAIMGPSGSGKSTLLDSLAGRLAPSVKLTGEVLLNGHHSKLAYGSSSFVTQDEILVGSLSVRETIEYAALLRLPSTMSYKEKIERVDGVLAELGLVTCENTKIGNWIIRGVSGGQKRRVAIGCELIMQPGLLFLDEPTSGLDAASAFYVMSTIRRLAEGNRTIISVIHQPASEVFDLFDKLCLLVTGQVVYFGQAHDAMKAFDLVGLPCPAMRNPSDHFLHVTNTDFQGMDGHDDGKAVVSNVQTLLDHYATNLHGTVIAGMQDNTLKTEPYILALDPPGRIYQSMILSRRFLQNNTRNIAVFWMRLAMYLMLCICIGTVFINLDDSWTATYSRCAILFFTVAFLTFMAISGFPAFEEDMQVFARERLNGYYGVSTFAIANTIASVPFLFIIALSCSLVVYWLVKLNDHGDRFPYFVINLFASLIVAESLMMAIAAIVPHYLMGIAAGAGMMGMYMLVCGFFQPIGHLPKPIWLYPAHYVSFHTFAFAGFMNNEFGNTSGWKCPCSEQPTGCVDPNCTMTGDEVLLYWTIRTLNKWANIGILLGMALVYRVMFFFSLKGKEILAKMKLAK